MDNKITIIEGSNSPDFLKIAAQQLTTYKTPQSIVDYININVIIGNPPYTNGKRKKRVLRAH